MSQVNSLIDKAMSTTRRVFLRSAALGLFGLPAWPAAPAKYKRNGGRAFERIFYDVRRPEALNFGETVRRSGGRAVAIAGNVEGSCYEDLRRCWQIAATPVAGMTDFRVLFLLQMMASDVGLRAVLRIHHVGRGAAWVHETFGSSACCAASKNYFAHAGRHWSRSAGHLVMNLAPSDPAALLRSADMRAANLRALDSRALVTWVIA